MSGSIVEIVPTVRGSIFGQMATTIRATLPTIWDTVRDISKMPKKDKLTEESTRTTRSVGLVSWDMEISYMWVIFKTTIVMDMANYTNKNNWNAKVFGSMTPFWMNNNKVESSKTYYRHLKERECLK